MLRTKLLAIVVLTSTFTLFAAARAETDDEPRKPRLAVLDFRVDGKVLATGGRNAAKRVRKEFNASDRYESMDRKMMRERLAKKDWAASVQCDTVKCLVKYGTSLGVEKIIGGSISSFGETRFVEIHLVDVNTGREEKTFARAHSGKMEDTLDIVTEGARELLGVATSTPADDRQPPKQEPAHKTLTLDCGKGVKLELLLIPAGTFTMGSNEQENEKPPHSVTISKPFYMGKYQVTQKQWQVVMGRNPSAFKGDDLPVQRVSWDDCRAFCKKLSAKTRKAVRLPTEAEWEYACRAGSTGKYCFGDADDELAAYAWYGSDIGSGPHPVGQKKPNAWGLYDMHGNVWQWCADSYGRYPGSSAKSAVSAEKYRVLRGGSWTGNPSFLRSATRNGSAPGLIIMDIGFRCVAEAQ